MAERQRNVLEGITGSPSKAKPRNVATIVLVIALGAAFVAQIFLLGDNAGFYGVSAEALREGRPETLVTHIFIHGGLWHIWLNASALLSVGGIVAERLGRGARAIAVYYLFFLLLGVIGGLGFVAVHPFGAIPAVGASGAICGLIGAAARIGPNGGLIPLWSRDVGRATLYLLRWNLVLVAIFWAMAYFLKTAIGGIAWEAHLAGFAAGLLLMPTFMRLAGGQPTASEPIDEAA